jgi:hypothetical protein
LLSAKKIQPGQTGRIEVSVKTDGMRGTLKKLVYVTSNDPLHPEVVLTFKATVEPEIIVSDYAIFFGGAPKGKEVRREVLLTLPAGKAVKILSAVTADPSVMAKLEPVAGTGGLKWKLIATQKADAKPGPHYGVIVVKTSSRLSPKLVINVRGTVTAPGK